MANMDLHNNLKFINALNATNITSSTTTNSAWIDTAEYYGLEWAVCSATITDGIYAFQLQESTLADHSDASVVDADFVITDVNNRFIASDDNVCKKVGYVGKKRYARLNIVSTGVTTGGTLSAVAILGFPRHAPVDVNPSEVQD